MEPNCESLPSNTIVHIDIKVDSTYKVKEAKDQPKGEPSDEPKVESKVDPKAEPKDGDKLVRLENGQFIRSSVQRGKINYNACCNTVLARRPTMVKLLEPDAKIFKGLDDVVPWDETLLPPLPEDLTPGVIASIKKGMLLGKLYKMLKSTLEEVCPRLSTVKSERLVQERGWVKKKMFRCPLCPKDFHKKTAPRDAYTHIEQYHTKSLVTCTKCQLSFTCQDSVLKHKASKHKLCKQTA
uniref:C2H2-type domain-containing protein n=1 Tax=Tetranychus urticae TaxID=32264 RepID=T1KDS0_TETUR